jgi:hypothetical protein
MQRPQKITFGEMRESGVFGAVVFCGGYHGSYSTVLEADRQRNQVRLSGRAASGARMGAAI